MGTNTIKGERGLKKHTLEGDEVHIVPESRVDEVLAVIQKANEENNFDLTWDLEDYEEPPV